MITLDTLADLLATLDFQKTKTVWRKTIAAAPARKQAIMRHYL